MLKFLRTNRQTDRPKTICPPSIYEGHKNIQIIDKSTTSVSQCSAVAALYHNVWPPVTFESKNKNFTKNSKLNKGHNSCKNECRVISLVCKYSTFYSEHIYFEFQAYVQ